MTDRAPPSTRTAAVVAAALIGMCIAVIWRALLHDRVAEFAAIVCYFVFALTAQRYFGLRERLLLAFAVVLTVGATIFHDSWTGLVERALDQATFLGAFMILLAMLREGAITSPSVLALGRYLTRQPPGRRYVAISIGGQFLGVVLNFGALSLLGPLIQRGARAGGEVVPEVAAARERRQLSALARGFSWIIAWSPTSIAQALVIRLVTGAEHGRVIAMGVAISVFVLAAGWLEDRMVGVRIRARLSAAGQLPQTHAVPFPTADFGRFACVCLGLAGLSAAVMLATGSGVIPALMIAAPVVTSTWIWLQIRAVPDFRAQGARRTREIVLGSIPASCPEAMTLSIAGYAAIVATGVIDARTTAEMLGLTEVAPLAIYIAIVVIVPVLSNCALPPMFSATFLGSFLSATPDLGTDPDLVALSLIIGWALNLTASPFSATALVLGRVTGIPGTTLSWRWNGMFTALAYGIAIAFLAAYSAL